MKPIVWNNFWNNLLKKSLVFAIIILSGTLLAICLPKIVLAITVGEYLGITEIDSIPNEIKGACGGYIKDNTLDSKDDEIIEGKEVEFSSCLAAGGAPLKKPLKGERPIALLIMNAVRWVMGFIGAIAVAFIVYGGILYITSGGDEKRITHAKTTLLYAIIGFVIAILAQVILWLAIRAIEATP